MIDKTKGSERNGKGKDKERSPARASKANR